MRRAHYRCRRPAGVPAATPARSRCTSIRRCLITPIQRRPRAARGPSARQQARGRHRHRQTGAIYTMLSSSSRWEWVGVCPSGLEFASWIFHLKSFIRRKRGARAWRRTCSPLGRALPDASCGVWNAASLPAARSRPTTPLAKPRLCLCLCTWRPHRRQHPSVTRRRATWVWRAWHLVRRSSPPPTALI